MNVAELTGFKSRRLSEAESILAIEDLSGSKILKFN